MKAKDVKNNFGKIARIILVIIIMAVVYKTKAFGFPFYEVWMFGFGCILVSLILLLFEKWKFIRIAKEYILPPTIMLQKDDYAAAIPAFINIFAISTILSTLCIGFINVVIPLQFAVKIFLLFTLFPIIVTRKVDAMLKWYYRVILGESDKSMFAIKILSQHRIKFFVYSLFFLITILVNFNKFNGMNCRLLESIEIIILPSFIAFLAFDQAADKRSEWKRRM